MEEEVPSTSFANDFVQSFISLALDLVNSPVHEVETVDSLNDVPFANGNKLETAFEETPKKEIAISTVLEEDLPSETQESVKAEEVNDEAKNIAENPPVSEAELPSETQESVKAEVNDEAKNIAENPPVSEAELPSETQESVKAEVNDEAKNIAENPPVSEAELPSETQESVKAEVNDEAKNIAENPPVSEAELPSETQESVKAEVNDKASSVNEINSESLTQTPVISDDQTEQEKEKEPQSKPGQFTEGQKVEANYRGRGKFYPARIRRDRQDGTYDVDYDDGESETRVKEDLIRSVDPSGEKTETESKPGQFTEGQKVEANYRGRGKFYPARIRRDRQDGTYDVDYDDGESETRVKEDLIRSVDPSGEKTETESKPGQFTEGQKVEANYRGRGKFYPARIRRDRQDGTYDVDYDDGESETRVKEDLIRSVDPKMTNDDALLTDVADSQKEETIQKKVSFDEELTQIPQMDNVAEEAMNREDKDDQVDAMKKSLQLNLGPLSSSTDHSVPINIVGNSNHVIESHIEPEGQISSDDHQVKALARDEVKVGMEVEANYSNLGQWNLGKVTAVNDDGTFDIDYKNGELEEGIDFEHIRRYQTTSDPKEIEEKRSVTQTFVEGAMIEANYRSKGKFYPGKIRRDRGDGSYDVDYDDGESEVRVKEENIRLRQAAKEDPLQTGKPLSFNIGQRVEANYHCQGKFLPAVIIQVHQNEGTYDVQYDQGEEIEEHVKEECLVFVDTLKPEPSSIELIKEDTISENAKAIETLTEIQPEPKNEEEITQNFAPLYSEGISIEANYREKGKYYPGKIRSARGNGLYDVDYDDGECEIKVKEENIRPRQDKLPQDEQNEVEEEAEPIQNSSLSGKSLSFDIGKQVEANYRCQGKFLPATIVKVHHREGTYDVKYNQGEEIEEHIKEECIIFLDDVKEVQQLPPPALTSIPPKESREEAEVSFLTDFLPHDELGGVTEVVESVIPLFSVGSVIEANYRSKGKFYPGKIRRDRGDGSYDVDYDDGESEVRVKEENIRLRQSKDILSESTEVIEEQVHKQEQPEDLVVENELKVEELHQEQLKSEKFKDKEPPLKEEVTSEEENLPTLSVKNANSVIPSVSSAKSQKDQELVKQIEESAEIVQEKEDPETSTQEIPSSFIADLPLSTKSQKDSKNEELLPSSNSILPSESSTKSQKEEKLSTKEDLNEIVEEKELLPDQSDLIISSEPLAESVTSHKEQQEADIPKEESIKLSSKEKTQDLVKEDESSKKEVREVLKEDEGVVSVTEVIESSKSHKEQLETDLIKEETTKLLGEELFLTSSINSNTDVLPSESSIKSQKEEESSSAKQNTVISEKKEESTTSTKEISSSELPLTSSTKSQKHAEADFSKQESKELVTEGNSSKEEVKEALKEDTNVILDSSVKEAIESVASQKEQRETDFSNEDSKVKEEELLPNTSLKSSTSILPSMSSNKSQKEKEKELEEGESKKAVAESKEFSKDILPSENSAKEIPTRPTTTESIQSEFEEQEKELSKEEERLPSSSVKSTKDDVLPSNSSTKVQRVEEKSFSEESKESKFELSESSTKSKKEKEIEKEKESQPKNDLNCPSLESRPSSALSSKASLPSSLLQAVNAKSILPLLERKHYKDSPSYQEAKKDIATEGDRLVKNIQLNQTKVQESMKEVTSLKTSIKQHQQKLDEMTNLCLSFLSDLKSYRTN